MKIMITHIFYMSICLYLIYIAIKVAVNQAGLSKRDLIDVLFIMMCLYLVS